MPCGNVNHRPASVLSRRSDEDVLNRRSIRTGGDLENLPPKIRKRTGQRRLRRRDCLARHDAVVDALEPPVASYRIRGCEGVTDRRHVGIDEARPVDDGAADRGRLLITLSTIRPGPLVPKCDRGGVDRIDDRVALDVDRRRVVRPAADEECLRAGRVIAARREAAGVANREVGDARSSKHAVVYVKIAGAAGVADAAAAIIEGRVPHPDVERVEIAERHPALVLRRNCDRRMLVSANPCPLNPPWMPWSTSMKRSSEYSLPVSKCGRTLSHDCSTATAARALPVEGQPS